MVLALVVLGGCSSAPKVGVGTGQFGTEGGTVRSADGKAVLSIPKSAVAGRTTFNLTPSNQANKAPAGKLLVPGSLYGITADKAATKPLNLSIQYDPAGLEVLVQRVGLAAVISSLEVARVAGNTWQVVPSSLDFKTNKANANISQYGVYGLLVADGSIPTWKLEVRAGTINLSSEIKALAPLAALLNRNYVYVEPSRNGQKPSQPLAIQVSGPDNFSSTEAFEASHTWSIFTLASGKTGNYALSVFADAQEIKHNFEVVSSALDLPILSSATATPTAVSASWNATPGAHSYELRLFDAALNLLSHKVFKTNSGTLETKLLPGQGYSLVLLAYNWDLAADPTLPYEQPPTALAASAAVREVSLSNPGEAKLSGPNLDRLSFTALMGKPAVQVLRFANQGVGTLEYSASISGAGFSIVQGGSGQVQPNSPEARLEVQGSCNGLGKQEGALTLTTNDPQKPKVTVPLSLECIKGLTATSIFSRPTHGSPVGLVRFSPDGSKVATLSSTDGQIYIWNPLDRVIQSFTLPSGATDTNLSSLAWSPDGGKLAASSGDGLLKVWKVDSGSEVLALDGLDHYRWIVWSPDGSHLAAANFGGAIVINNATSGVKEREIFPADDGNFSDLRWSTGNRIVLATANMVRSWNPDGTPASSISFSGGNTNPILSPDGSKAVKAFGNSTWNLEVRDTNSGAVLKTIPGLQSEFDWLAWSPGGNSLAVSYKTLGGAGHIEIWDYISAALSKTLAVDASMGAVYQARPTWSPNGLLISTALTTGLVRILNVASGQTTRILGYHTGPVSALSFADGKLFSSSLSRTYGDNATFGSIAWADYLNDQTLKHLFTPGSNAASVKGLGNQKIAALLQYSATFLRTYDIQNAAQLSSITLPIPGNFSDVSLSIPHSWNASGSKLLYTGNNPAIMDTATAQSISLKDLSLTDAGNSFFSAFSWNGDSSKVYGFGGTSVGVWDALSGNRLETYPLRTLSNFPGCNGVVWAKDGSKLLCHYFGLIYIFDTASGMLRQQWGSSLASGSYVPLSWDYSGRYLLILTASGIEITSESGLKLTTIPYQQGCCQTSEPLLEWSPDGKYIGLGGIDGSVYVWQLGEAR